ncbi:M28 family peptidase, partial [Corallococcus exercitus]
MVRELAGDIGLRVLGTRGARRAEDALVRTLRGIPGLEVEVQQAQGMRFGSWALDYRVRNVVARLPGQSPEAVLVSAHYDSPPESVGRRTTRRG